LLRATVADCSPLAVVRALMPETAFTTWIRPRAYDAQEHPDPVLADVLPAAVRSAVVGAEPAQDLGGDRYCRRCGTTYTAAAAACEGCGISLTRRAHAPA